MTVHESPEVHKHLLFSVALAVQLKDPYEKRGTFFPHLK